MDEAEPFSLDDRSKESEQDLPILDWLNHFFSSLDRRDFMVSRRKGASVASSTIIQTPNASFLAKSFIMSLQKEHVEIESRKKLKTEDIKSKLVSDYLRVSSATKTDALETNVCSSSYTDMTEMGGSIEITENVDNNNCPDQMIAQGFSRQLKETSDLFEEERAIQDFKSPKYTASCKWDLTMFSKHVTHGNFQKVDYLIDKFELIALEESHKLTLRKKISDDSQVYPDVSAFGNENGEMKLIHLAQNDANETVIRSFLNHILTTVCLMTELTLHPEQCLTGKEFTCPRADYVFKKNGIPIGTVEVKTSISINRNVIVQLLLQLIKIQSFNKSSAISYCGLLSDGYRYVFVLLKGSQFIFESEVDHKRQSMITSTNEMVDIKEKVRIFHAKTWSDLYEITSRLITLLDECLASLKLSTKNVKSHINKFSWENDSPGESLSTTTTGNPCKARKIEKEIVSYSVDKEGVINID